MLSILGKIYGAVIDVRNAFYDRGVFKTHDLGPRTISVGNLTTGGTGKTPVVAAIAHLLAANGEKVCILTRGYGRKSETERVLVSDGKQVLVDAATGGDEPVELAQKLLGKAIIVADADRVAAAKWAKENYAVTAFILDDGFQHRRAKRDVDIVCIDATDPCGNGKILPAGRLRESFSGLKRADALIITRPEHAEDVEAIEERLRKRNPNAIVLRGVNRIAGVFDLTKANNIGLDGIRNDKIFAFCGLGNPEAFFQMLRDHGLDIRGTHAFADHHSYNQSDAKTLSSQAKELAATVLVTTAKDAVKLTKTSFELRCYVVEIETVVVPDVAFRHLITSS